MVNAFFIGPFFGGAGPQIPIQGFGYGIGPFGCRAIKTPVFVGPGNYFAHFSNHPPTNQQSSQFIVVKRMHLNAHLGNQIFLIGHFAQFPRLSHIMGQGFLAIDSLVIF